MKEGFSGRRLMAAFSFLTIFSAASTEEKDAVGALTYFPFVGLLVGCLLWACAHVLGETFDPAVTALLLVSILNIVTRGAPLDGLAATLDGFGSGSKRHKEILEIMLRDQRGTFGVIILVLALLGKYLFISQLIESGSLLFLLFFPTVGRWSMFYVAWFFPVLQKEAVMEYPAPRGFLWATGITLLCAVLIQGLVGVGIMVLVWVGTYGLGQYCVKKIGGITTHVMGAGAELAEIFSLAVLVGLYGSL
jgi:adenosylcobinamide-GDP ribazoletransferase